MFPDATLDAALGVFGVVVNFVTSRKVVTWDDETGSMFPFGSNRTYAKEELEGRGTGASRDAVFVPSVAKQRTEREPFKFEGWQFPPPTG